MELPRCWEKSSSVLATCMSKYSKAGKKKRREEGKEEGSLDLNPVRSTSCNAVVRLFHRRRCCLRRTLAVAPPPPVWTTSSSIDTQDADVHFNWVNRVRVRKRPTIQPTPSYVVLPRSDTLGSDEVLERTPQVYGFWSLEDNPYSPPSEKGQPVRETAERISAAQEEIVAHERSGKRTKPQLKATNVYRSMEPEPVITNRRSDLTIWDFRTNSDYSLSPSLALVAPHQSPPIVACVAPSNSSAPAWVARLKILRGRSCTVNTLFFIREVREKFP
ncbi:hypothetical protein U1Q18_043440 [Sarracenia purpurea var. burkii]